ncbi:Uma2 family endonuclease [Meiothermus sp. CFH 77666]|uniref:Uma2 family endonuclease n=1 Tax=Meiothermus sp. CFH 77666 TaxID=2817942 RepID=UPI001AA041D9|nr:Uma2 family endonuclease [Meiothermus sp. CFH 77666]MBO1437290.1 Uma2 family endonuclease [Meiothermus sp. CFH 77666]
MPRQNPVSQATFAEFLEMEAKSQARHEFVDGFVFAMAGGTDYHNRLVATEAIDRGEKLLGYQKLPGLQAYVLVSQLDRRLEVFQRLEDGGWRYEAREDGVVRLPCANAALSLDDLYRGIPVR